MFLLRATRTAFDVALRPRPKVVDVLRPASSGTQAFDELNRAVGGLRAGARVYAHVTFDGHICARSGGRPIDDIADVDEVSEIALSKLSSVGHVRF